MAATLVALAPGGAFAQTWQGGSSTWSNSGNWLGTAPVSGGTSALTFGPGASGTAQNDFSTFNATSITFASGTTWLTGSAIRLATSSGTSIFNLTTAGTQTLGFGIDLGGTSGTSTRIFTGTSGTTALSGTSWTVFSGNLSGTGGVLFNRTAGSTALPRFVLSGTNNYTGNTELGDAYLVLSGTASLASSGTLRLNTANQGVLDLASLGSGTLPNNVFVRAGGSVVNIVTATGAGSSPIWLTGNLDVETGGISVSTSGTVYVNSLTNSLSNTGNAFRIGNTNFQGTVVLYGAAQPSWNLKNTPLSVNNGTVIISHSNAIGTRASGTIALGGGTLLTTLPDWNVAQVVSFGNVPAVFSGTGNITLRNTIVNSGSVTQSNSRFTKSGPMTLTLAGTNVYANTTSVTEGVLLLSNSMSLPGGIEFNAVTIGGTSSHLRIDGGVVGIASGTFSRTLGSGTGTNDVGGNRVNLNSGGFAAYAANQVVNLGGASGVVTWGAGGFNGVASGSFMATATGTFILGSVGATHAIDFQNPINFSGTTRNIRADGPGGILSGVLSNGGLAKLGDGTLTLAADNLYTGTTTVSAGTLQVGNGGSTGSIQASSPVSVSSGAALAFNRSDAVTYSGTVSGAGGLTKLGASTLTLDRVQAYTGTTSIVSGTVRLSGSGQLQSSARIDVASGATLAFNRADGYGGAYNGKLAGTGNLRVESGTLNITGGNTFTGTSRVLSGAVLDLDGQIGNTALFVDAGARLMGTGTSAGLTTIAGLHDPGNSSPGIQYFDSLTYASGTMRWELIDDTTSTPGVNYDQILLTGSLTFNPVAQFNLVFNGAGSTVDWTDAFWNQNREWLVYNQLPAGNVLPTLVTTNWQDAALTPNFFNTARPQAYFMLQAGSRGSGAGVYVVYRAIPEPGSLALAGIGLAAAAAMRRRLRRRRQSH